MQCENKFCVYCDKEKCTLPEVALDAVGMCVECVYVEIPKNVLETKKEKMRREWREKG